MLDTSLTWSDVLFMLKGAWVTISLTLFAVLGGTSLGLLFGLVRASGPWWASSLLGAILDVFRSIPLLIQFVLINSLKSMLGLDWPVFWVACITLSIYAAAYCAEIVRAGILAVPITTRRAARSLGLTYTQDLTCIVLPIASRIMLPSWMGLVLGVMKDTALVLWIGIVELLRASQTIITRLQEPMLILAIAGLIYFLMSYPLARLGARLEEKWRTQ
jgi:His/Glu/Gln/Arg/opine family amino acid ABC transporter permease subunit